MSQNSNKSAIHPLENSRAKSRGSRVGGMADWSKVYLDYAAATPVDRRVSDLMAKITAEFFGNPSSVHSFGAEAKKILEEARQKIARLLAVKSDEIIFTGSGTESINLAILGLAMAYKNRGGQGGHIITSQIEHLSVLRTCQQLQKYGFKVDYLPVEKNGVIDAEKVVKAVRPDTVLVSIQYANNEIGTIQPIKEIAGRLKAMDQSAIHPLENSRGDSMGGLKHRPPETSPVSESRGSRVGDRADLPVPLFHVDACQAAGFLNIRPEALGVDLLSFNGSKIYGPKGVGVLFKKNKVQLEPLIYGGSQEKGLRAGTENVALVAGMALVLELVEKNKTKESKRLADLRDWLIEKIQTEIPDTKLNGDAKKRLPNNINISFKNIDGEMLMLALSRQGFAVSTGSACTTSETGPSHVISALGSTKNWENLRISLGRETTQKDLERLLSVLKKEVKKLRSIT